VRESPGPDRPALKREGTLQEVGIKQNRGRRKGVGFEMEELPTVGCRRSSLHDPGRLHVGRKVSSAGPRGREGPQRASRLIRGEIRVRPTSGFREDGSDVGSGSESSSRAGATEAGGQDNPHPAKG